MYHPEQFRPQTEFEAYVRPEDCYGEAAFRLLQGNRQPSYVVFSPKTEFTKASRISAILDWAQRHSDHILVVEGSFLSRWNLAALRNLPLDIASELARVQSLKIRKRINRVIEEHGWCDRIRLFDYEGTVAQSDYRATLAAITDYANQSTRFSAALRLERDTFLSRRGDPTLQPRACSYLTKYLLEEIAVFLHINLHGYAVEVYPGPELSLLRAIVAGEYPDFPVPAAKRAQVCVAVRQHLNRSTNEDRR